MLNEEINAILKRHNPWWYDKEELKQFIGHKRDVFDKIKNLIETRDILIISGVRRAGKTTILYQLINFLVEKNTNEKNIVYVNMDDPAFAEADYKIFDKIMDYVSQISNAGEKIYLFLDEVQNISKWEKWIKINYDLGKNIKFIITGSNSNILSTQYITVLSGRSFIINVMPFSFSEVIDAASVKIRDIDVDAPLLKRELKKYIQLGGFPEIVLEQKANIRAQRLKEYYDSIMLRDIIYINKIKLPSKLNDLCNYYMNNFSSLTTFRKLSTILGISKDTVIEYTKNIEKSHLIFLVSMFSFKIKEQMLNPKKIYCIDSGFPNAIGFKFTQNLGRLYENFVFVELKRKGKEVYYWKNKKQAECDFVIKEGLKITEAVQVCYDIENPDTKKREINGLTAAMSEFKLKQGLIITEDYEDEQALDRGKIKFIPLWKWLLI